jgi:hypothetical protein
MNFEANHGELEEIFLTQEKFEAMFPKKEKEKRIDNTIEEIIEKQKKSDQAAAAKCDPKEKNLTMSVGNSRTYGKPGRNY